MANRQAAEAEILDPEFNHEKRENGSTQPIWRLEFEPTFDGISHASAAVAEKTASGELNERRSSATTQALRTCLSARKLQGEMLMQIYGKNSPEVRRLIAVDVPNAPNRGKTA